jgi:hypothetical protein
MSTRVVILAFVLSISSGSRRHTPRKCQSCKGKGTASKAEKNKEEKGIQMACTKENTKQAVATAIAPSSCFCSNLRGTG